MQQELIDISCIKPQLNSAIDCFKFVIEKNQCPQLFEMVIS